jgi:two-component system cell cycle sensor histidine kinase/response regulator CckA
MPTPQGYDDVISGFLRQISEADARASMLRATNGGDGRSNGHADTVFAELDVALEELHTAEEELRAQNEELLTANERVTAERQRYLELFQDAPVAYLVSDIHGIIQEANRAACELLHRPDKFLRGKPIAIFAPEAERASIRDAIHDLIHLESPRQRLEIILSPNGTQPFTAHVIASRVPGRAGAPSTIRWTLVDHPKQEEASAGRAERAMVTALHESNDEAIVTVDRDNRVTWWNRGAELTFGYSSAEVVGKPSPVRLPEHFAGEEVFERKDGRSIKLDVSCLILPPTASDGYMFRMRRVRSDRRQHPEAAGQRVVARLAGGMAHHLNNVMQIVVSGLEFAGRDLADREQLSTDLQTVREAAFRAVAFTRALVSYTGQDLAYPTTMVNLNTLVEGTVAEVTDAVPDSVEISTFLDPRTPEIRVDPVAMGRVIRELIMNGARATGNAGKILIETADLAARPNQLRREQSASTGYVRLSVHDNGTGMTEETRVHLFEPFFAIRSTGNAVGLGLSAAWGLVARTGGFIRVESKEGAGSTFHVYLPKTDSAAPGTVTHSLAPEAQI